MSSTYNTDLQTFIFMFTAISFADLDYIISLTIPVLKILLRQIHYLFPSSFSKLRHIFYTEFIKYLMRFLKD